MTFCDVLDFYGNCFRQKSKIEYTTRYNMLTVLPVWYIFVCQSLLLPTHGGNITSCPGTGDVLMADCSIK